MQIHHVNDRVERKHAMPVENAPHRTYEAFTFGAGMTTQDSYFTCGITGNDHIERTVDITLDPQSTLAEPMYYVTIDNVMDAVPRTLDWAEWRAFPNHDYETLAYYTDGSTLCNTCALKEWHEHGVAHTPHAANNEYGQGVMCEDCTEWICEPVCVECRDELDKLRECGATIYTAEDGSHCLCGDCMNTLIENDFLETRDDKVVAINCEQPRHAWYMSPTTTYPEPVEEVEEVDDDPRCVCGTHASEHQLCGCGEWQRAD